MTNTLTLQIFYFICYIVGTCPDLFTGEELESFASQMLTGAKVVAGQRNQRLEMAQERFLRTIMKNLHVVVCIDCQSKLMVIVFSVLIMVYPLCFFWLEVCMYVCTACLLSICLSFLSFLFEDACSCMPLFNCSSMSLPLSLDISHAVSLFFSSILLSVLQSVFLPKPFGFGTLFPQIYWRWWSEFFVANALLKKMKIWIKSPCVEITNCCWMFKKLHQNMN